VSQRPLVFVTGLTVGDYVLWSWSLSGNHAVLALVSGLSLPPLAVVFLWLLAMSAARLLARVARRPGAARQIGSARRTRPPGAGVGLPSERTAASAAPSNAPSRKLAA
jgi:hypothetical protein